jgi:hypothetical protein
MTEKIQGLGKINKNEPYSSELDLYKDILKVKNVEIKELGLEGVRYASLKDKDREYLMEMVANCNYSINLEKKIIENAIKLGYEINKEDMKRMLIAIQRTKSTFTVRFKSLIETHVNIAQNHLIETITKGGSEVLQKIEEERKEDAKKSVVQKALKEEDLKQ